jgi:hypothetical protein
MISFLRLLSGLAFWAGLGLARFEPVSELYPNDRKMQGFF